MFADDDINDAEVDRVGKASLPSPDGIQESEEVRGAVAERCSGRYCRT